MSFHIKSPLILSKELSLLLGQDVFLKLDNLQPPGSFKIRGIGNSCNEAVKNGAKKLVGSSGGNAGVAMAYAAEKLNVPLVLFVPKSTPPTIADMLKRQYSLDLHIVGNNWFEANREAENYLAEHKEAAFIHPFEGHATWDGHATIVHEVRDQLKEEFGIPEVPSAFATCVGGGGLAIGIVQGLKAVGWNDVPLFAMETFGTECLNKSVKENRLVKLDGIHSIAKSLGSLAVSPKLFELTKKHEIISDVVSDKSALDACFRFARNHRLLVEPACGAALSVIYDENQVEKTRTVIQGRRGPFVVVVCGGNMASIELLLEWKKGLDE